MALSLQTNSMIIPLLNTLKRKANGFFSIVHLNADNECWTNGSFKSALL